MTPSARPSIVVLSTPGGLEGIEPPLERAGVRVVRLASAEPRAVPPAAWRGRLLRGPPPDAVLVTSRAAVEAGVRPWRRASGPFLPSVEFWAVGPRTEAALRAAGVRRVRRPPSVGADGVLASWRRRTPRTIVHLRSDVAGPALARALRAEGHRVVDLVVYRLRPPPSLSGRAVRSIRGADLLVVTSPSGLTFLRRRLDRPTFSRLARTVRLVVLGERSGRAARKLRFRHVSVAPTTTAQRFTQHLLGELRHVSA